MANAFYEYLPVVPTVPKPKLDRRVKALVARLKAEIAGEKAKLKKERVELKALLDAIEGGSSNYDDLKSLLAEIEYTGRNLACTNRQLTIAQEGHYKEW